MSDAQANFIDAKCNQLNLNVTEFFDKAFGIKVSRKVDKKQASAAIQKLNDYQQDKSLIPDNISSYTSDWRN
jgi:hypothetical protein